MLPKKWKHLKIINFNLIQIVAGIQSGSVDELGRPIKRSGLDSHPHLTNLDQEIFGQAPTLDHFHAVPLEEPVIDEVTFKPDHV